MPDPKEIYFPPGHPARKGTPEGFLVTAKFANRVTDLEQQVKSLESQLRVQQALIVDLRLAVKGLQKP